MNIKVSIGDSEIPLQRQTPGWKSVWRDKYFHLGESDDLYDAWIIYGAVTKEVAARCPTNRTIFVTAEPPSVKQYDKRYLSQFSLVVTCDNRFAHPNVIQSQQAMPWMIGRQFDGMTKQWLPKVNKDYDELQTIHTLDKTKKLSIVAAAKRFTPGHELRFRFLRYLKKEFGSDIDIFGDGFIPILDKWDAIAPYQYHLTIENSTYQDYWTEKLSDCYLGGAFPLYSGCPNIERYFAGDAMSRLNLKDFAASARAIKAAMDNDLYERSIDRLIEAKTKVLDEYQFYPMLSRIIESLPAGGKCQYIVLKPEAAFTGNRVPLWKKIPRKAAHVAASISRIIADLRE